VRNLKHVHVLFADQLNAYDAVVSDDIVFTKGAFESFVASRAPKQDGAGVASKKNEEAGE
jgi:large subunit ribosomal protein L4